MWHLLGVLSIKICKLVRLIKQYKKIGVVDVWELMADFEEYDSCLGLQRYHTSPLAFLHYELAENIKWGGKSIC